MRIEIRTRPVSETVSASGKMFNARLIDTDGSVLSERLFLRDVCTKATNDKRVADVQRDIDSGYRFPLLRLRRTAGAGTLFAPEMPL